MAQLYKSQIKLHRPTRFTEIRGPDATGQVTMTPGNFQVWVLEGFEGRHTTCTRDKRNKHFLVVCIRISNTHTWKTCSRPVRKPPVRPTQGIWPNKFLELQEGLGISSPSPPSLEAPGNLLAYLTADFGPRNLPEPPRCFWLPRAPKRKNTLGTSCQYLQYKPKQKRNDLQRVFIIYIIRVSD